MSQHRRRLTVRAIGAWLCAGFYLFAGTVGGQPVTFYIAWASILLVAVIYTAELVLRWNVPPSITELRAAHRARALRPSPREQALVLLLVFLVALVAFRVLL